MITRAATAGAVPDQADHIGHAARGLNGGDRHIGHEIGLAVERLRGDLRGTALRNHQLKHTFADKVAARFAQLPGIALVSEFRLAEGAADRQRRFGPAIDAHGQAEIADALGKPQRHPVTAAATGVGECFDDAQHHLLRALRRNRIHAQLEIVALGCFQQAGVDVAAHDILEYRLTARLVDRHRLAQHAIHVHREAGHALSRHERKLQLALKHAPVRIEKRHLDFGLRKTPADFDTDAHRLQLDGLIGARRQYQPRRLPDLDGQRFRLGGSNAAEADAGGGQQGDGQGKKQTFHGDLLWGWLHR